MKPATCLVSLFTTAPMGLNSKKMCLQFVDLRTLAQPVDGCWIQIIGVRYHAVCQLHSGNGKRTHLSHSQQKQCPMPFMSVDTVYDVYDHNCSLDAVIYDKPGLLHDKNDLSLILGIYIIDSNKVNIISYNSPMLIEVRATPQVQSATSGCATAATVDGWRNNASISRPCSWPSRQVEDRSITVEKCISIYSNKYIYIYICAYTNFTHNNSCFCSTIWNIYMYRYITHTTSTLIQPFYIYIYTISYNTQHDYPLR